MALLDGTVSQNVAHPPALVARLGPGVGAVLDDVPDLVAVVTGVLLLGAVPGDVSRAVTFVAAVLLLATLRTREVRIVNGKPSHPPRVRNDRICCTCSTFGHRLHRQLPRTLRSRLRSRPRTLPRPVCQPPGTL